MPSWFKGVDNQFLYKLKHETTLSKSRRACRKVEETQKEISNECEENVIDKEVFAMQVKSYMHLMI